MPGIASLAPDQRAVLSLVLEKNRDYDDIASLLAIDEADVRARAQAAFDAITPSVNVLPPSEQRAAIGDYLLGQQDERDAASTLANLGDSPSGRVWARALGAELVKLGAARELCAIPPEVEAQVAAEAPSTPSASGRSSGAPPFGASSRRGGAILIAIAGVGVAIAVAVLLLHGGSHHVSQSAGAGTGSSSATGATGPSIQLVAQVNLVAINRRSHALGVAQLYRRGAVEVILLAARGLAPTSAHMTYGAWLYNPGTNAELIGTTPPVGRNGRLAAQAPMPANTSSFRALLITVETPGRPPQHPGRVVLAGSLSA